MMVDKYVFAARELINRCIDNGVVTCDELNELVGKKSYEWDKHHGWRNLTYENTYVIPTAHSSFLCMPVPVRL